MTDFQANGLVGVHFLFHNGEMSRMHFIQESFVNVLLHHALAELLSNRAQFILGIARSRYANRGPPSRVARKRDGNLLAGNTDLLIPAQRSSDHLAIGDFE